MLSRISLALIAMMTLSILTAPVSAQDALSEAERDAILEHALEPWTGDLEGIRKRGFLRLATANSPLYFTADGFQETGLAVEVARELEKHFNRTRKKGERRVSVVLMPMARDRILPAIVNGRADMAAANLTITPEREKLVAFSIPSRRNVRELVVTGPAAGEIGGFDDLVDVGLNLRRSSSYFAHVGRLNAQRAADGKQPIPVVEMDEYLEDYDILEMMDAGIVAATIVDDHKADIWAPVFENLTVHEGLFVNEGGTTAWAMRKESPELLAEVNRFVKTVRKGSLLGNIFIKRYLNPKYILESVHTKEAVKRYDDVIGLIRKYSEQYAFEWLMIAAQGFQESRLDQSKVSHVGAIGIMQVMPQTAADPAVGIPDISEADKNVHAGVRYLRYLRENFFDDPEIQEVDRVLLSFAAYNAGPGAISRARRRAVKMGLDPNVWFDNVEIAAARSISREPVIYVRNIYKYYVAYRLASAASAAKTAN